MANGFTHPWNLGPALSRSCQCPKIIVSSRNPFGRFGKYGDSSIFILTNLPISVVNGLDIAQFYRQRWNIETFFQTLTVVFNCEIKTLGYPKAALFAFCVALVSYNILSVVLATLRSIHGTQKIEQEVSSYYLVDEISGTYRGMMIAIPYKEWQVFARMSFGELTEVLRDLANHVNLASLLRHPRASKNTDLNRTSDARLKNSPKL